MATKENVKVTNFYPDSDCIVLEIDGIFVNVSRDEDGDVYVQAIDGEPWSTSNKVGMGNIYVLDMFKPHDAAIGAEQGLSFNPTATLYWHEK